jgi:hypothetical protein
MFKILISIFIALIVLTILTLLEIQKISNPRAEVVLVNDQNYNKKVSYRDFWLQNKDEIKRKFNPYVDSFHSIDCIDQIGLRELIVPTIRIKELSNNLTSDALDDLDVVYILHQYVYKNIEYEFVDGSLDTEEILNLKRGDCSEKSILLSSLLNSEKIPNYVANTPTHRYVFVLIDGIWLPIDSTSPDFYFALDAWDEANLKENYVNSEIFMFNQTHTVFNREWC